MPAEPSADGAPPRSAANPSLEQHAWQLARPELERRSRRWYDQFLRVMESTRTVGVMEVYRTGPGVGAARGRERRARRLASLQFAVGDVVQPLSRDEQEQLRNHERLPDGFVEQVVERAKVIERQTRW